jgi:hypothetical protein
VRPDFLVGRGTTQPAQAMVCAVRAKATARGAIPASFLLSVGTSGGSPLLQQGELDFQSSEKSANSQSALAARRVPSPGLKPIARKRLLPGALKRSSPRMNARAPTESPTPEA